MRLRDYPAALIRTLDSFGPAPEPPPVNERPRSGIYRSGRRDDYETDRYARANLSPEKIGLILRNADAGDTRRQYELWEKVEQDPHVGRLYLRRRQAVLANPLNITPADAEDPRAVQAAELCRAALFGGQYSGRNLPGISNLDGGLFDMTDAIGKAFSVNAPQWETINGLVLPVRMNRWPQSQFQLGDPASHMAQDQDDIRVITDDAWNGKRISDFAFGTWLVHTQKTFSQPLARAGMFRSITWYYLFKTFGVGDWSILLERYGIPPRVGKYAANTDQKAQAELFASVVAMGKDHAAIIPDTTTIELIEQRGQGAGGAPHPALVEYCDAAISIAIAGNTMAVDQGDRGARSAKEAYQAEDMLQARFDANGRGQGSGGGLAGSIRSGLLAPIVRFNLGEDYPLPKCSFDLDNKEDLAERIKLDETAGKMGYPLTVGYMANKYYDGIIPEGFEPTDLLETSAAATSAALSDPLTMQLLADVATKKKSMSWAISKRRSRGE